MQPGDLLVACEPEVGLFGERWIERRRQRQRLPGGAHAHFEKTSRCTTTAAFVLSFSMHLKVIDFLQRDIKDILLGSPRCFFL